jgi:hypothetical protein
MADPDILSNPGAALAIGAFVALMLIGLFRKARKLFIISVLGITITVGLFVVKMGS